MNSLQHYQVSDLTITQGTDGPAVLGALSLEIPAGTILGVVGESGSGKTTLARALVGDIRQGMAHRSGTVEWNGHDLFSLPPAALRRLRGAEIAFVPQHASGALTPTRKIGDLILEPAREHGRVKGGDRAHVLAALEEVGLPDPARLAGRYPHQLSGGQRQRVALAIALSAGPSTLVLDEPTSGLDATTKVRVLRLLEGLRSSRDLSMVIVTHDLGIVSGFCDSAVVMYAGEIVEAGPTKDIMHAPQHPYTRALLDAVPRAEAGALPRGLRGRPPAPDERPAGCWFEQRCPVSRDACRESHPVLLGLPGVRCHFPGQEPPATPGAPSTPRSAAPGPPILEANHVTVQYRNAPAPAVRDVDLTVRPGEVIGVVGESGSGKTTLALALAGLAPLTAGQLAFAGTPMPADARRRTQAQRTSVQLAFQHADRALNPRHTVAKSLERALSRLRGLRGAEARREAIALLEEVGLSERHLARTPGQLSGGEQQRVALARALAAQPQVLVCDEIVSALDVSVQARILHLLDRFRTTHQLALVFVSHDLAVVRGLADRVIVMHDGTICETGDTDALFTRPQHPYTAELLAASLSPLPGDTTPQPRDSTYHRHGVPTP